MTKTLPPVGIDDLSCYLPSIYLDIRDLAQARNIAYEKLSQGLGLLQMAFPDVHEDAATMAAEAIADLMDKNRLRPEQIGRIYLGTESALDDAKPTATYAAEMVQQRLGGSFRHCDVADLTFACIGAVDALQNCLDWVAADAERIAIVVASDIAKYDLHSSGEYTQGAGAVAVLVKWNPRLLVIPPAFGVAMESVHDFYKPRREQFSETPVFDGPFSNLCYQLRMSEAMAHFRQAVKSPKHEVLSNRWERMIFHLPYSFHAKRIFVEEFVKERQRAGEWENFAKQYMLEDPQAEIFPTAEDAEKANARFLKSVSQTPAYLSFVKAKLEKAQRASSLVGNLYTASVFLALMSTLESDLMEQRPLTGTRLGFVAYGSGSKAKVFEGIVQPGWEKVVKNFGVFQQLQSRTRIDYDTYEALHTCRLHQPVAPLEGRFALQSVGHEGVTLGARYYGRLRLNGKSKEKQASQASEKVATFA
jgi:hydroxymethylglutaryl-CoA synthase